MILAQLIGVLVLSEPEPQKVLTLMGAGVKDRLSKMPPEQQTTAEHKAYVDMIRSRIDRFFSSLDRALIEMAGGQGPLKPH
jgi:hypothetical protein